MRGKESHAHIVQVNNVVRHGSLRWFGQLERTSRNDWVSSCRYMKVAGMNCVGRGRKTWVECEG